jgi:hypothetical protein
LRTENVKGVGEKEGGRPSSGHHFVISRTWHTIVGRTWCENADFCVCFVFCCEISKALLNGKLQNPSMGIGEKEKFVHFEWELFVLFK